VQAINEEELRRKKKKGESLLSFKNVYESLTPFSFLPQTSDINLVRKRKN